MREAPPRRGRKSPLFWRGGGGGSLVNKLEIFSL